MAQADEQYRPRAERYLARALNYRDDANLLRERERLDSAGALMYESAKQCINAVANLQDQNPGPTGAKVTFLRNILEQSPGSQFDLMRGWRAATHLHLHADRGHMTGEEFNEAWIMAEVFVGDMLAVYADNSGDMDDETPEVSC